MNAYYIVLTELFSGVIPSQVIAPVRHYAAALPHVRYRIVFLEPARVAWSGRARRRLAQFRALWPDGRFSLVPFVGRLGPNAPAVSLRAWLALEPRAADGEVFHCRGPEPTTLVAPIAAARKARLLMDARGSTEAETLLRVTAAGGRDAAELERIRARAREIERQAVHSAHAVSAVCAPLAARYREWPESRGKDVTVVPCCVERTAFSAAARQRRRRELGVGDEELLLVHVSTQALWESFDDVMALFRAVAAVRPARLLMLTRLSRDVVLPGVAAGDPIASRITVRGVPPQDVAEYLSAADVGLLLRRATDVSRMSSPIKFAEYLAAGLAVVASRGIGETAEQIAAASVGITIPPGAGRDQLADAAQRLLALLDAGADGVRARALAFCDEHLTWSRQVARIEALYGLAPSAAGLQSAAEVL